MAEKLSQEYSSDGLGEADPLDFELSEADLAELDGLYEENGFDFDKAEQTLNILVDRFGDREFYYTSGSSGMSYSGTVQEVAACPIFQSKLHEGPEVAADWILSNSQEKPEDDLEDDLEEGIEELDESKEEAEKPAFKDKDEPRPAASEEVADVAKDESLSVSTEKVTKADAVTLGVVDKKAEAAPVDMSTDKLESIDEEVEGECLTDEIEVVEAIEVEDSQSIGSIIESGIEQQSDVEEPEIFEVSEGVIVDAESMDDVEGSDETNLELEPVFEYIPENTEEDKTDYIVATYEEAEPDLTGEIDTLATDDSPRDEISDVEHKPETEQSIDVADIIEEVLETIYPEEVESVGFTDEDYEAIEVLAPSEATDLKSLLQDVGEIELDLESEEASGYDYLTDSQLLSSELVELVGVVIGERDRLDEVEIEPVEMIGRAANLVRYIEKLEQATSAEECHDNLELIKSELIGLLTMLGYDNPHDIAEQLLRKYDIATLKRFIIILIKTSLLSYKPRPSLASFFDHRKYGAPAVSEVVALTDW